MALADEMPLTAAYVAERRQEWGAEHVKAMVAAGMQRGRRNCFWAVERITHPDGDTPGVYKTVGTPFDAAKDDQMLANMAALYGQAFMGMMQPPKGWAPKPVGDGNVGVYSRLPEPAGPGS
jgi:hypothetical protein